MATPKMAAKLLAIALACLAAATPLTSSSNGPCLSDEFSLAMRIGIGEDAPFVSLTAIDSGTPGTVNIVGEKLERYPGTPVYQKGVSPNATLGFDIKAGSDCESHQTGKFVIWVPDLGESYGRSDPIQASKKSKYPHFSIGEGFIYPQLTAASQGWYACNITVQGESYWGLSWGVYNSNSSAPYGCVNTSLKRNFNIPCGS